MEIIKSRLVESMRHIERTKDYIKSVRIRADYREAIVDTLNDILDAVYNELLSEVEILSQIASIIIHTEREVKIKEQVMELRSKSITDRLDYLLYIVERIMKEECSSDIYSFVNYYWWHLIKQLSPSQVLSNDIRMPLIIIVKSHITRTGSLIRLVEQILGFSCKPRYDLWIIECPLRAEKYPLEWPIILHEVIHILHDTLLNIVPKYYRRAPADTPEGRRYNHSLEYLCDFLATQLIGPVYPLRIKDFYFIGEYEISLTHPAWTERLMLLNDYFSQLLLKIDYDVKNQIEEFLKKYYTPPSFTRPDKLRDILNEAVNMLNIDINMSFNVDELKNAIHRLSNFLPYTKDVTMLFNAAYIVMYLKGFNDEVKKYFEGNEQKLLSEFFYLISDCVRLCYTRQLLKRFLS
jgi:hypothetical protein